MTTKNQTQAKKVTGMESIPYLSMGVAADTDGYVVSEDGLTALVEASLLAETVPTLQAQVTAANAAKKLAEDNLITANATIAARDASIVTLTARVEELESEGTITQTIKTVDKNPNKTKGYNADADPINMLADSILGVSISKKKE